MRCKACDALLTEYEATRKTVMTGEYIDLCNNCFKYIQEDVEVVDRPDLRHLQDEVELDYHDDEQV